LSVRELAIINQGPEYYEFSSNFDGVRYYLVFNYNRRNDTWYMDLKDATRQTLLAGLACLTDTQFLVTRFGLDNVLWADGEILISDSTGEGEDPSYLNFGAEVSAFYLSIIS